VQTPDPNHHHQVRALQSGLPLCRSGAMALRRLLASKGYNFAEELDLGLLDKQFRRPFALAETLPPPKHKKRRKHDLFGEEDDDQNGEDLDGGIGRSSHKTDADLEREEQLREEREHEARQWDNEFSIRRNVDRGSNALLREQFVVDAKQEYSSVRKRTQKQLVELEQNGMLDRRFNVIRAQTQRRVMLAKHLKLDEIKGRTVQEVIARIIADLKQRLDNWEDNKDGSDGLEDVLRAEEQIRRLLGDREFEELGHVARSTIVPLSTLLLDLSELSHAQSSGSAKAPGFSRVHSSHSSVAGGIRGEEKRQKHFDQMMQELRRIEGTSTAMLALREKAIDERIAAFERVDAGLKQRADDKIQSRAGAPWNAKPRVTPETDSIMSLRQRQRLALKAHVDKTQASSASAGAGAHGWADFSSETPRGRLALSARGSSPAQRSAAAARRPGSSEGVMHGEAASGHVAAGGTDKVAHRRRKSSVKGAGVGEGDVGDKGGGGMSGTAAGRVEHDKDGEVIIIPGAPTPKELLQIDDMYGKKRREVCASRDTSGHSRRTHAHRNTRACIHTRTHTQTPHGPPSLEGWHPSMQHTHTH
jgi:hypothetical protein